MAVAFVAVVSFGFQVDRECSTFGRRRAMHGTWSVQLISGLACGHEAELVQYILHADLGAERLEVDACHASPQLSLARFTAAGNREEAPVLTLADMC